MSETLISVIIPAYNVASYISKSVESVLSQTYRCLEVIVIDDGSTDETGKLLDNLASKDNRVTIIKQHNQGAAGARNAGLDRAKGEYILFVDADDELLPNGVSDLYYRAIETQSLTVVGKVIYVDKQGEETCRSVLKSVWTTEEMIANMYTQYNEFVIPGGKLFHRSLFNQLRFPRGKRFEDSYLLPKLYAKAEKIALIDTPIYRYYYQRTGNTVTSKITLQYLDRLEALKRVYATYKDNPKLSKIILNRLYLAKKTLWIRAINQEQWKVCRAIRRRYWDEKKGLSKADKQAYQEVYEKLKERELLRRYSKTKFFRIKSSLKRRFLKKANLYKRRYKVFVKRYRRLKKFGYFANCVNRQFIFTKSQVRYIDVPKTASTSILKVLLASEGADVTSLKPSIHEFAIQKYSQDDVKAVYDYFSFSFVRNPFERVVSTYKNMYKKSPEHWFTFKIYWFGWFQKDKGFAYFVQKGPTQVSDRWADEHCVSQHVIVLDKMGRPYVDFIGRFEQLERDWAIIQEKTCLPNLPHLNQTAKDDWRDYYTVELANIVYKRYEKDFELLGYQDEYQKLIAYLDKKVDEC